MPGPELPAERRESSSAKRHPAFLSSPRGRGLDSQRQASALCLPMLPTYAGPLIGAN